MVGPIGRARMMQMVPPMMKVRSGWGPPGFEGERGDFTDSGEVGVGADDGQAVAEGDGGYPEVVVVEAEVAGGGGAALCFLTRAEVLDECGLEAGVLFDGFEVYEVEMDAVEEGGDSRDVLLSPVRVMAHVEQLAPGYE